MRTIHEMLRLRFDSGLSERQTARSLGVPRTTVQDYLARFRGSGLSWPLAADIDETTLEQALFVCEVSLPDARRALPDWATIAE